MSLTLFMSVIILFDLVCIWRNRSIVF